MFFTQAFIASALASIPVASAAIIDVFVGGEGKLAFTPENVKANVGDSIRFTFGVKNHTVTQSTFDNPCSQITDASGAKTGFFSGYMPVPAGQTTDLPQFWIPVKDTKPIWAFCQQANHCQQGMVFAVNAPDAPAANSFDNWKAKATAGAVAQPAATPAAGSTGGSTDGGYGAGYGGGYGDGGYGGGSGDATPTATATPAAATDSPASSTVSVDPATGSPLAGAASGSGNVIKVTVGADGLTFTPNIIKANPGDIVQFEFHAKNHTVTQSTFAGPCSASAGGFDSGFQPVAATATTFPTWSLTVNDTNPIWGYCKQATHCQQGMVFAINSDESSAKSFSAFQTAAKASSTGSGSSSSGGAYGNAAASTKTMGAGVVLVGLISAAFGLLL